MGWGEPHTTVLLWSGSNVKQNVAGSFTNTMERFRCEVVLNELYELSISIFISWSEPENVSQFSMWFCVVPQNRWVCVCVCMRYWKQPYGYWYSLRYYSAMYWVLFAYTYKCIWMITFQLESLSFFFSFSSSFRESPICIQHVHSLVWLAT